LKTKNKTLAKKYVVQRNELLYGTTTVFNVNDLKLFKLIISKVNSQNILFDEFYEITSNELKELNINPKHLYNTVLTSLKKLANVYMKIESEKKDEIKEVGLIQNNFTFKKYSSKFYISFHQDMKDYLLDIQEKYTRYPLEDILNLKLKHSLKLYEYLKSISFNELIISLEKLKKRIDIPNESYDKYGIFKQKVLEPVLKEINEKTSINVKYEPIKDGRKVVKIKFTIERKKIQKNNLIEIITTKETNQDNYTKYRNQKFNYNGEPFQIIEINKNENIATLKNINSDEIGKVNGKNEQDLIDKLEILINNEN